MNNFILCKCDCNTSFWDVTSCDKILKHLKLYSCEEKIVLIKILLIKQNEVNKDINFSTIIFSYIIFKAY